MSGSGSAEITLRGLVTARWVLLGILSVAGLIATIIPSDTGVRLDWLPTPPNPRVMLILLTVWAGINFVTVRLALGTGRATSGLAGAHLVIDATMLTVLLATSGGATNPFTTLYFVPITLATQVSPRWTWSLAGFCLACFGLLFVVGPGFAGASSHQPPAHAEHVAAERAALGHASTDHDEGPPDTATPRAAMDHTVHSPSGTTPPSGPPLPGISNGASPHTGHFAGHLRGMWVAFGVSGALITYFVHRISLSLTRQRNELAQLREAAIQDRHLAGLGSLAAGAAHELGTPLGTIKLLVNELPQMAEDERLEAVATIKSEVGRCKEIVQRMASPDARVSALASRDRRWRFADLVDELTLPADVPVEVDVDTTADKTMTNQPRESLAQIARELVTNAAEACRNNPRSSKGVHVLVSVDEDQGHVTVRDDGCGMDPDVAAAAFDPFFSTKPEGEGMGLGLYLARAQMRQLGGEIQLESSGGQGTELKLHVPLRNTQETL